MHLCTRFSYFLLVVTLSVLIPCFSTHAEEIKGEFVRVDGFVVDEQKVLGNDKNQKITSFKECVAAGNPVMRSMPPKCATKDGLIFIQPTRAPQSICKDLCGDGNCDEMVCMAQGCPCAESKESCPKDCS